MSGVRPVVRPREQDLVGKVAIVTGATSGIGRATALLLARQGAVVVGAGRREALGRSLLDEMTAEGLGGDFVTTDVSRRADCVQLVEATAQRFGRLDILVNNAAAFLYRSLEETTEEEWDSLLSTNLKSVYLVSRAAIPHLRAAGGGAIVNVASVHAFATMERVAAYAASKGAIVSLSRQMALDLAADGIRVNSLVVGGVDTAMAHQHLAALGQTLDEAGFVADEHVVGRVGRPEEVAQGILFLVSRAASFVNGAPLIIDGGLLTRI